MYPSDGDAGLVSSHINQLNNRDDEVVEEDNAAEGDVMVRVTS